jgi:RHS repeat-associated protein
VGDGTFTYEYNSAGRMVRAESVTVTLVYTYNAQGLRVAQSVDGDASTYAWDWASGLPEMLSEGGNLYLVGHDTLGRWDGGTWTYHLPDALGSVRQMTDGAGAVASSREWTPFGVEVGAAQAGLGYTGEWFDDNAGMVYLRARWYYSQIGSFLNRDPVETEPPYQYVRGNPINGVDPSGYRIRAYVGPSLF